MRDRTRRIRPLLLVLGLGLVAAGPVPAQPVSTAPISGLWKLNADLSDHLEDKLQDARRPGAYTGMAGGRMHGRVRGTQDRNRPQEDQEMANLIYPVLQLLIRQDDSTVAISDAAGQMQTFYTDGRKVKEPLLTGPDLETSARWKDRRLTIERKQDKGGTLKETYDIDPNSKKLVLSIRMTSPTLLHALEFRRVYDPAPGN